VTSLLDVQHLDLPGMFTRSERAYRSVLYDRVARRADAVVTISEHAKQRMVEALGLDPERVHVAYLGVDTDRFAPNAGPREDFVYYPARGWPHKNHATLVAAMELVRSELPLRLVLTGGALDALGSLPDWVDVRGLVSPAEVVDLYRRAACLAFPSLYEGFGLPPLEAMAAGCPVAASDIPVIAEVCGPQAELFDAHDPASIAEAILRAVATYPRNQASGLAWVSQYTWGRCADVHVDAYRQAADCR
jgi:glycosyltransferase involved in cell wall biosynthesis